MTRPFFFGVQGVSDGLPTRCERSSRASLTTVTCNRGSWRPLPEGTRLGRYVVDSLLGRGGMGAVYLGHDPVLDRPVALKVTHESGRERWRDAEPRMAREARMLARVSDPHVVQVFDVGRFEGGTFVAMERVEGVTIREWCKRAPRRAEEVLAVFEQAGRGLAAIHGAGLVHRDFKPANALVGAEGRLRVLDFGLAVGPGSHTPSAGSFDGTLDATRLTTTGAAVGTPAYMAPEQHLGGNIDARADQFAFCLALYEALVGRRPYQGKTSQDLARQKLAGPTRPVSRRIPRRLRRTVLRGLQANRSERWPSMDSLLGALVAA